MQLELLGDWLNSMRFYKPEYALPSKDVRAQAFSLIELVVVIAILSILISIALPRFSEIRKDAQVAQAKNILSTILKECKVAIIRDSGNAVMSQMPSARGSVPGFGLRSLGSSNLGDCLKSNLAGEAVVTVEAYPIASSGQLPLAEVPSFLITYYEESGQVLKECNVESYTKYKSGCSRNFATNRVCIQGGDNSCTQWIDVPVQSVGTW